MSINQQPEKPAKSATPTPGGGTVAHVAGQLLVLIALVTALAIAPAVVIAAWNFLL